MWEPLYRVRMGEKFETFKYEHAGPVAMGAAAKASALFFGGLTLALAGVAAIGGSKGGWALLWPASVLMGLLCLSKIHSGLSRRLYFGERFMMCGSYPVYYGELSWATPLGDALSSGVFEAGGASGAKLRLEQSKFSSQARKAHKIEAGKRRKFEAAVKRVLSEMDAFRVEGVEKGARDGA